MGAQALLTAPCFPGRVHRGSTLLRAPHRSPRTPLFMPSPSDGEGVTSHLFPFPHPRLERLRVQETSYKHPHLFLKREKDLTPPGWCSPTSPSPSSRLSPWTRARPQTQSPARPASGGLLHDFLAQTTSPCNPDTHIQLRFQDLCRLSQAPHVQILIYTHPLRASVPSRTPFPWQGKCPLLQLLRAVLLDSSLLAGVASPQGWGRTAGGWGGGGKASPALPMAHRTA